MNARTASMAADNVERASDNKNADAERLFRKYGPMVVRRCRQMLGNDDEAADAAQDVFAKFVGAPELLATDYPSALLWKMATNYCLNAIRERTSRGYNDAGESLLEKIACSSCDNNIEERVGYRGVLNKLFKRHPKSSRVIAVLHLFDNMTLEETAREVGMSVSGVRKRLKALETDLKTNFGGIL